MQVKHQFGRISLKSAVIIALFVALTAGLGIMYQQRSNTYASFRVDIGTIMSGGNKDFSFDVPQGYLKGKVGPDRVIISNCSCVVIKNIKPCSKGLLFNCRYSSNNKIGPSSLSIITLGKKTEKKDIMMLVEIAVNEIAPFSMAQDKLVLADDGSASQIRISLNRGASRTKTALTIADISRNLTGYIENNGDYAVLNVRSKEQADAMFLGYLTIRHSNGFARTIYVTKGSGNLQIAESKSLFMHKDSLVVDEIQLSTDKTRLQDVAYSVTPNRLSIKPISLDGSSCLVKISTKEPLQGKSLKFFIQEEKQSPSKLGRRVTELNVIRL